MGIMAALAFVLGLLAVAVWVAKRFGGVTVSPGSRIQIEVVQRIPFGPKAGLAVVRVGEKVMAVSVGPDGIRPLFEVDEADRQHVIATSQGCDAVCIDGRCRARIREDVAGHVGSYA